MVSGESYLGNFSSGRFAKITKTNRPLLDHRHGNGCDLTRMLVLTWRCWSSRSDGVISEGEDEQVLSSKPCVADDITHPFTHPPANPPISGQRVSGLDEVEVVKSWSREGLIHSLNLSHVVVKSWSREVLEPWCCEVVESWSWCPLTDYSSHCVRLVVESMTSLGGSWL